MALRAGFVSCGGDPLYSRAHGAGQPVPGTGELSRLGCATPGPGWRPPGDEGRRPRTVPPRRTQSATWARAVWSSWSCSTRDHAPARGRQRSGSGDPGAEAFEQDGQGLGPVRRHRGGGIRRPTGRRTGPPTHQNNPIATDRTQCRPLPPGASSSRAQHGPGAGRSGPPVPSWAVPSAPPGIHRPDSTEPPGRRAAAPLHPRALDRTSNPRRARVTEGWNCCATFGATHALTSLSVVPSSFRAPRPTHAPTGQLADQGAVAAPERLPRPQRGAPPAPPFGRAEWREPAG